LVSGIQVSRSLLPKSSSSVWGYFDKSGLGGLTETELLDELDEELELDDEDDEDEEEEELTGPVA